MTIWDGGGNDTYDFSNYSVTVRVDLRPGEWTVAGQLANLGNNQFARGNIANALLYNDDPRSLIENAIGGSGADTFVANAAANRLTGNGGADFFVWRSVGDAGIGAQADTVTDFVRGADKIDLGVLDANAATVENDTFAFIGTNAFHNVAGELRYQVEGANLRIQGDVNGDGVADFEILLNNNTILTGVDFLL
jgi:serralysin